MLNSCTYYVYPPKKKVQTEYNYIYKSKIFKDWKTSTWRKYKTKSKYVKYDKNGNELELGEYGERWCKVVSKELPDSSIQITSYSGSYPKKLDAVTYKTYNEDNQILTSETWRFKDNKKDYLRYKTIFSYKDNKLIKETEFNDKKEVINIKDYSRIGNFQKPLIFNDSISSDTTHYDSLGRIIKSIHYYKGKFSSRREVIYNDDGTMKIELRYDDKQDSLWSITEWRYDYLTKQITRKYWNVINSSTERLEKFIYDRKKLLKKINRYNAEEKTGYTKYKYKLY